jgi:hypothetical protein
MKTFQDYLTEAEYLAENPAIGDGFAIEIAREEIVLESYVVDIVEDGIVIEADDTMMRILTHVGYLTEDSRMHATAQDSTSPINGRKDARRYNFETSPDTDLEEQQTGTAPKITRPDPFGELDAAITASKSGQAQDLSGDIESFRSRVQSGQAGKGAKWSEMSDTEREALRRQGFGPKPPTNEELTTQDARERAKKAFRNLDTQSDPKDTSDADRWAKEISTTVPKTRIDTRNLSPEQGYELDVRRGIAPPGGFDAWKQNRERRMNPQTVTPSTTMPTNEAKYRGREVPLGKKMAGDVKKSKVYVRKPNGNIVKVEFGDPNMRIKKSNPARRRSFRARHNCDNPGPRWKARYWSCRSW